MSSESSESEIPIESLRLLSDSSESDTAHTGAWFEGEIEDAWCGSDVDDEQAWIGSQVREYCQALLDFSNARRKFELIVPIVSQWDWKRRAAFVTEEYEDHLHGLSRRVKNASMSSHENYDELEIMCAALRIGWQLHPDCWVGLQMMLDYFAEDTLTDDILRLQHDTLFVLKQIGTCKIWPSNPIFGPLLASQAKRILSRFQNQCGFLRAGVNPFVETLFPMLIPKDERRICDGVGCFRIETSTKFKCCAKCMKAYYCGKECQTIAWKNGHKQVCN